MILSFSQSKILNITGGLNGFNGYPTSPSASEVVQNIKLVDEDSTDPTCCLATVDNNITENLKQKGITR